VLAGPTGFDTWTVPGGPVVRLEAGAPSAWAEGLAARGHAVEVAADGDVGGFGHAHLLAATEAGWAGAADPRALIGAAAGY
jgi:gamma-glutamyltranspeptidase